MIKDIMVQLDGTPADEIRLSHANAIAERFEGYITGLFLNVLPFPELIEAGYAAAQSADFLEKAREAGDKKQAALSQRLSTLARPAQLCRFDVFWDDLPRVAGREARCTDVLVSLRPDRQMQETESLIEGVLFGAGRHLILIPEGIRTAVGFDNILVGWNGSREAARALSEALPYMRAARSVMVLMVDPPDDGNSPLAVNVIEHLKHHGISAEFRQVHSDKGDVSGSLLNEARERDSDLIVMGGYGHSRLREWLLSGVTYKMLHTSPVPLLLAH